MKRIYNNKTGKQVKIGGSTAIPVIDLAGKKLYVLTTAVTSGVTTDSVGAVAGDFAVTTHATGRSQFFVSNGTNWVGISDSDAGQATFVAALTGAGGGTANGALEDEGVVTTAGGNTYADAAINTPLGKVKNNIKELAASVESIRAALVAAGLMAGS